MKCGHHSSPFLHAFFSHVIRQPNARFLSEPRKPSLPVVPSRILCNVME
ncbi:hypothetical protein GS8_935 [Geobacillus stearothermophilus]|uniref:Uncharacterized protein n=1 Tax=Geobacillus stearothermophilus TaxID=1422 RepID=A0A150MRD2_GEOSE|nr:hypothetical protein GS8_935 [Geobacillus stearothermophilus]KYD27011.1 hypothetical protein B4109_1242 [Geobacillus stearothermophilus]